MILLLFTSFLLSVHEWGAQLQLLQRSCWSLLFVFVCHVLVVGVRRRGGGHHVPLPESNFRSLFSLQTPSALKQNLLTICRFVFFFFFLHPPPLHEKWGWAAGPQRVSMEMTPGCTAWVSKQNKETQRGEKTPIYSILYSCGYVRRAKCREACWVLCEHVRRLR